MGNNQYYSRFYIQGIQKIFACNKYFAYAAHMFEYGSTCLHEMPLYPSCASKYAAYFLHCYYGYINSVCYVLGTNMATHCIVLHADKFILIYLHLTKVPYPKPHLNYEYSILHLLEQQVASYVRDEFG